MNQKHLSRSFKVSLILALLTMICMSGCSGTENGTNSPGSTTADASSNEPAGSQPNGSALATADRLHQAMEGIPTKERPPINPSAFASVRVDYASLPGWPVKGQPTTTSTGLMYYDLEVGAGDAPRGVHSRVRVHYSGYHLDGRRFDSSYLRPTAMNFFLNDTVEGWKEGVAGMRVGGKRKMILPGRLAFGDEGLPLRNADGSMKTDEHGRIVWDIEPDETVVFDIELIGLPDQMDYRTIPAELPGWRVTGDAEINESGVSYYDHTVGQGDGVTADTKDVVLSMQAYMTDGTEAVGTGGRSVRWSRTMYPTGVGDGIVGMREGGQRKLVLTSDQAFGEYGMGSIPGKATVIFDVMLSEVFRYDKVPSEAYLPGERVKGERVTTSSGLAYYDLVVGSGAHPADQTSTVEVVYSGWLVDGQEFDASYYRGDSVRYRLAEVMPGWREGVATMRVGGKRKLIVPHTLAYGEAGRPEAGIPQRAVLVFDVELLDVEDASGSEHGAH